MPRLLEYDLGAGVKAFSTERQGGVSRGAYSSFNANRFCGDEARDVESNRRLLCRQLGISTDHLVIPHQVHQTNTLLVTSDFLRQSEAAKTASLEGIDALLTAEPGVCVGVSTADCIPVVLHDPRHHAVAAIHAGWRGTVERIVVSTLGQMHDVFGTLPEDVCAAIGPGISLDSFEVGDEVYESFEKNGFEMAGIARRYPDMRGAEGEKWHIDLPGCNHQQLVEAGIRREKVQLSGLCTYREHQRFFSARRLGILSGRILTAVMVKEVK